MSNTNFLLNDIADNFDNYINILYRYSIIRVRDPEMSENLVQDTLVTAVSSKASFKGTSTVLTWLTGILKHKIIDHFRKIQKEKISTDDEIEHIFFENHFDKKGMWKSPLSEWSIDPSISYESGEFWQVFEKCLNNLPRHQADVFILKEFDGEETSQICKDLNITPTNLWVKLHRTRDRLRSCLESNWFKGH